MNPILSKMFSFFISVILPLILGYLTKTFLKIKKEKLDILLFLNIMFVTPISMILVFWNLKLSRSMIMLPILGFLSPLLSGFLGYLFCKRKYDDSKQKGSYIISNMLSNRGTIGGLTMFILYGEQGYAYVHLILLFASINIYFIAYPIGNYYSNKKTYEKSTFKSIIFRKTNLPIAGILIGILLYFFGGERPDFLSSKVELLVKFAAWFALIPVGASIDFHGVKKHLVKVLDISIIKFIIMPIITALAAYPLIPDEQMATTLVIISMMPVAINAVVVSKLTKLDENVSIAAFLFTTTIYLLFIFPMLALMFT